MLLEVQGSFCPFRVTFGATVVDMVFGECGVESNLWVFVSARGARRQGPGGSETQRLFGMSQFRIVHSLFPVLSFSPTTFTHSTQKIYRRL